MPNGPLARLGRRIRAARETKSWSQADLARLLGRTPAAVSYWETGLRAPGIEDVLKIADALGLDPGDLLPPRPARVVARAIAARLDMADLTTAIDGIVERFDGSKLPPARPLPSIKNPSEMAATVIRVTEQAAPPTNIELVMERLGVTFLVESLADALSGFMIVLEGSPIVVVNRDHASTRQNFSAAHELGHIVLAHYDAFHLDLGQPEGVPPGYNWRHEREANEFASSLLMPSEWISVDLESTVGGLSIPSLALRYKVSSQAMGIRLSTLGMVDRVIDESLELPF